MKRYELAAEARAELREQYDYLIEASGEIDPALRLQEGFEAAADMYAGNPDLGSRDVVEGFRAFLFGTPSNKRGWIAFYRPTGDGIVVLRVFRGVRDFGRLM